MIEFYEDNHLELYNLKEDISEEHNLADVEVEKERAQKMHQDLDVWRISVEAKIPERNPDWKEPEQPGKNIDSAYI